MYKSIFNIRYKNSILCEMLKESIEKQRNLMEALIMILHHNQLVKNK